MRHNKFAAILWPLKQNLFAFNLFFLTSPLLHSCSILEKLDNHERKPEFERNRVFKQA